MPTADRPTSPLPSEVTAVLARKTATWTVDDIALLYRHLDHDPIALSWPSAARMHVRAFIECAGPGRPRPSRSW